MTAELYRERARLVAHLAAVYPARICANDQGEPTWPVIYIDTPEGQLSWHLAPDDVDLFAHVPQVDPGAPDAPAWDGHTTPEKYDRLARLTRDASGPAVPAIDARVASHVLWHYGELGYEPGSFTARLIELIVRADPVNRRRLALTFPAYVAAVGLAEGQPDGTARLRAIARGGR